MRTFIAVMSPPTFQHHHLKCLMSFAHHLSVFAVICLFATLVPCTNQEAIYQERQRTDVAPGLQSHLPVTGVLKWEILENALGSSRGYSRKSGCSGGCSRECSRRSGVLQGVLPRVLFCGALTRRALLEALLGAPPMFGSTLGSTPPEHPDFREHPREHFPEHFQGFPTFAPL